jgi:hypothetical protein
MHIGLKHEVNHDEDILYRLLLVDAALDSVCRFLLDARHASLADLEALYGEKAMQPSFSGQSG